MRHEQIKQREAYDIVDVPVAEPAQPEAAAPDLPPAVGGLIAAAYIGLILILALTMARSGPSAFIIAIDVAFVAAFLSVPWIFLSVEQNGSRRPSLSRFLHQGIETATGHLSGSGALVQMLIVPVLLALGLLAIGIASMVIL